MCFFFSRDGKLFLFFVFFGFFFEIFFLKRFFWRKEKIRQKGQNAKGDRNGKKADAGINQYEREKEKKKNVGFFL